MTMAEIEISAVRGQTQHHDFWGLVQRLDEHCGAQVNFGLSVWPGAGDVANLSGGKRRLQKALWFLLDEGVIDEDAVVDGHDQLGLATPAFEVVFTRTQCAHVHVVARNAADAKRAACEVLDDELAKDDDERWAVHPPSDEVRIVDVERTEWV